MRPTYCSLEIIVSVSKRSSLLRGDGELKKRKEKTFGVGTPAQMIWCADKEKSKSSDVSVCATTKTTSKNAAVVNRGERSSQGPGNGGSVLDQIERWFKRGRQGFQPRRNSLKAFGRAGV